MRTNAASIDIDGEELEAQSVIATSGLGKVTLRGFNGAVTLHQAVTAGSGGIDIRGNDINFSGPLTTPGGDVLIGNPGAAGSVTGWSGGTITTESGSVTIVGGTSVSLEEGVVTGGPTNGSGQGLRGGRVDVSTVGGAISLQSIDTRGGASTSPGSVGGSGGMISIRAGGSTSPTVVTGDLLASAGTGASPGLPAAGGAIVVNANSLVSPGDTTLIGEVTTQGASIDLRGDHLEARGAISTSGLGGVTLRGNRTVSLFGSVTTERGPVDIESGGFSPGAAVGLNDVIATSGGNVSIRAPGAVMDRVPPFLSDERTIVTTTAADDSGVASGNVTISAQDVDFSRSSIDTSGAANVAGDGSVAGELRITTPGPILLKGVDARGGASSHAGLHEGAGGVVALRANVQSVRLGGDAKAGSLELHGEAGVTFSGALITRGGDIGIDTGPTGQVTGSLGTFGGPTPITTTAAANSGAPSGNVTISGQLGVTLKGNVTTTGAANNAGTVSAGGNVHISSPGGSIDVWGVDTRNGVPAGTTPTFGGGTIALEAGGPNSTVEVAGMLSSGTSAMSLLAQESVLFAATGGVEVDVGGLSAGSYTRITASRTLLIGGTTSPGPVGTVQASFFNNFALAQGDRVPFYRTPQSSISGSFATKILPPRAGLSYATDVIELVWNDRPPRITSNGAGPSADISVPENQLPVATLTATDPELDAVSFSLSGDDSQLFEVLGNTALNFRSPPDFEAPQDVGQDNVYDVTAVATDAFGETDEQELEITVTAVNEAPMLTVISPVSIQQNTTDVEILSATDPDRPPQSLAFSLGGADAALLRLASDPQGKRLQFVNPPLVAAPADADGDNVYELAVTVDDGAGAATTRPVRVTVRAAPVMTVGVTDQLIPEGQSGTTPMVFTVALSMAPTQTVTVDYQTLDGTSGADAVAGSDYVARSGTLTFQPTERFKTIPIDVIGDTEVEGDETFQVVLSNPVNTVLGAPLPGLSPRATGTILNDDEPFVGLRSAESPARIEVRMLPPIGPVAVGALEGDTGTRTLAFPVVLTQHAFTDVDVQYQVVSPPGVIISGLGTATAGVDFVAKSGTLTFVAGEVSKTIDVTINGDMTVEPHEAFKVILSNAVGATLAPAAAGTGLQSEAIGIIIDDDGLQAVDDAYTITQGQALSIAAPGLLANDIERDPFALPLVVTRAVTVPASGGSLTLPWDGSFFYMPPDPSFTGTQTFVYEVLDSIARSSRATVTITVLPDGDLDGVADAVEAAAPNGGDGNGDGIADSTEASVASLQAATLSQYVTLVASPGTTLANVTTTTTLPPNPPAGSSFPLGLLGFEVRGISPGGSAQVTLMLPPGVGFNVYDKFGPEPGNTTPHWYAFSYNGTTGAQISGSTVTLRFVDGQRGDADLDANSVIVDPGAPSCAKRAARTFPCR